MSNRDRIVEIRGFLELPPGTSDEEVFIHAHHAYHQSLPESDRKYGKQYYNEYVASGERELPFYMRVVRRP